MHSIELRTPTDEEQKLIRKLARPDISAYAFIFVLFGVGPIWMLGKLGYWLADMASPEIATYGQIAGWTAGGLLLMYMLAIFVPDERKVCKLASKDRDSRLIQEIHVSDPRVFEITLINNNSPILAIDIGDDKILYLQGQWMYHPAIYTSESIEEFDESKFNGMPARHAFPSSDFTISRFPNCGEVASICVNGSYRPPETEIDVLKPEYSFRDSELLDGEIDNLAEVLELEHVRRGNA